MSFAAKYKTIHTLKMTKLSDILSDLQVQNTKFQNDYNNLSSKLTQVNTTYKRIKRRFDRTEYSIEGTSNNLIEHQQQLEKLHDKYEIIRNISSVNYNNVKSSMYVDICINHYAHLSYGARPMREKLASNPCIMREKLRTLEQLESLSNVVSLKSHLVSDIEGYRNDIETFKNTLCRVGRRKTILSRQYFKLRRETRRVDKEISDIQQRIVQTKILLKNEKCKLDSFLDMFTMS